MKTNQFAKDHWSLLLYLEGLCQNGKAGEGVPGVRYMRTKTNRAFIGAAPWHPQYTTRIHAGDSDAVLEHVPEHDDWDCLNDLEGAGMVERLGSPISGFNPAGLAVKMTEKGLTTCLQIRLHKNNGGKLMNFRVGA
jgi:hypothetical protein